MLHKCVYPVLSALKIRKLETKKWSEEMVSIYDFFSLFYQHLHTDTEVSEWFANGGFENITLCETREAGFDIYGDLKTS